MPVIDLLPGTSPPRGRLYSLCAPECPSPSTFLFQIGRSVPESSVEGPPPRPAPPSSRHSAFEVWVPPYRPGQKIKPVRESPLVPASSRFDDEGPVYTFWRCVIGAFSTRWTGQGSEQEEWRPRVGRLTTQSCEPSQESYCLNNGQCMLLVDLNQHHCKCERGYYGPRCAHLELVFQPMGEEQLLLTVVFVALLMIGLAGALYFFCRWYKRIRCPHQQTRHGYHGVQSA
ncbi:uncharacterized protein LOC130112920 [Lampris incognitus]|uniref:uncharacterized protein LOC130112920 n=1 Tax=Lampris incognitus TaxID=2546036 RepID=UPI0024B5128C|nr:uncharacterized protein LOC130112920 [Lampris incognitus]